MFKRIYIEEQVANHKKTLEILNRFSSSDKIYIDHYKDVFNRSGQDWRYQKEHQALILAKRTEHFLYKGSEYTPSFGESHFYYNTLILNCIYDCDYCYLQGMFPSAHVVLFVNEEDFIFAVDDELNKINSNIYLALSYDTDILAFDGLFGYSEAWINYVENEKRVSVEMRTKSANINVFKNKKPNDRTILAWSLSPQSVIELFENKTASLESRIRALNTASDMGWPVRICIDPMLKVPNWKQIYDEFLSFLTSKVNLNLVRDISVGSFRMNHAFLKRMKQQRNDTPLLFDDYIVQNESISYKQEVIDSMKQLIDSRLQPYIALDKVHFQN